MSIKPPRWAIITLVFSILVLFAFYNLFYIARVWPNTYFGGINLAGEKEAEVRDLVSETLAQVNSESVVLEIDDQKIEIKKGDLGVKFDQEATVERIMRLGRNGNLRDDLATRIKAPFNNEQTSPVYDIDFALLVKSFDNNLSLYEKKAKSATIGFVDGRATIIPEEEGRAIDRLDLVKNLKANLDSNKSGPIKVVTFNDQPKVNSEGAKAVLGKVEDLTKTRIALKFGFDSWILDQEEMLDFLQFYPEGQRDGYVAKVNLLGPLSVTSITLFDSPDPKLSVSLDGDEIGDFIETIARTIDRKTVDATLKFEGGRVLEFTPAADGQELDRQKTRMLLESYVSGERQTENDKTITINLPVEVTRAKIASSEINTLGIRELIGRGISYFSGSITNRIHNIGLGTSRISGTLVKPGETFSFNGIVGEVSAATGFRQAYVISSGRTVLDDGGGICQVSSTVFRAALNSGLPIVARTAHAYRVGYYEQRGFKPGFDATVWAPAVDFKFKNDTDRHILIQATIDYATSKLQVDIYGTGDSRKVIVSEPVLSNQSPPLPDKYQDDPTLPKGVVKQVDFAAPGATSVFTRKVHKGNDLVIDETFRSNYRPWQAIFLVGKG